MASGRIAIATSDSESRSFTSFSGLELGDEVAHDGRDVDCKLPFLEVLACGGQVSHATARRYLNRWSSGRCA